MMEISAATGLPVSKIDAVLVKVLHLAGATPAGSREVLPEKMVYSTGSGEIQGRRPRGQLISMVDRKEVPPEMLCDLTCDERNALAIMTGINPDGYYLDGNELDRNWSEIHPEDSNTFTTMEWAAKVLKELQHPRLDFKHLEIKKIKNYGNTGRELATWLKTYIAAGGSFRTGEIYPALQEYLGGPDLGKLITVIEILGHSLPGHKNADLPLLETPAKITAAPTLATAENLRAFTGKITGTDELSGLLKQLVRHPGQLEHLNLEERCIIGLALEQLDASDSLPQLADIAAASGELGLTAGQVFSKTKVLLKGLSGKSLGLRYATADYSFDNSSRAQLIHALAEMPKTRKYKYMQELPDNKRFLVELLTAKRNGFYLTNAEMAVLWYYRYGKRRLPWQSEMFRELDAPASGERDMNTAATNTLDIYLQQLHSKLETPVAALSQAILPGNMVSGKEAPNKE
jgi:hypothetical protein